MKAQMLLLGLALLMPAMILGDALPVPHVLRDPQTKVVYHLESDGRHIAAISPKGKLLWRCAVIEASDNTSRIESFELGASMRPFAESDLKGEDFLVVGVWKSGFWTGIINKKTGVLKWEPDVT
jgi:hypothetical protein